MKYFREKRTIILQPFLLFILILIVGYTLISWVINIKLQLFGVDETFRYFLFAPTIGFFSVVFFLRRRLQILKLDKGTFGYLVVATMSVVVPIFIAQEYMQLTAFPLVLVHHVQDIYPLPGQRFFQIDHYVVDTAGHSEYYTSWISGKSKGTLNYQCHVVMPINPEVQSAGYAARNIWYAFKPSRSLNNSLTDTQKEEAAIEFEQEVTDLIKNQSYKSICYFEYVITNKKRNDYLKAIRRKGVFNSEPIILEPQFYPLKDRISKTFYWIFGSFGLGILLFTVMVLLTGVSPVELSRYNNKQPPRNDDLLDFIYWISRKKRQL